MALFDDDEIRELLAKSEAENQELRTLRGDILAASFEAGAAVAFGLMGMAEAIRKNVPCIVHREYWTSHYGDRLYNLNCPACGAYLKGRVAGLHEGTDLEYCGACRDSI